MDPSASSSQQRFAVPIQYNLEKSNSSTNDMKYPIKSLAVALDGLNSQTMQMALLGQVGSNQEISDLRTLVRSQDERHKEGISEIQGILDGYLQNEVTEQMRKQVEQEITTQIAELVNEQVAECLKAHLPQDVQEEVVENKRELEELNLALHNSESRRSNGKLRSNQADGLLATFLMPNGTVSPRLPRDLKGLFGLNADTALALMTDYGLPNPSTVNKDHNLNRLLQFCGVRYQLVRRDPSNSECQAA